MILSQNQRNSSFNGAGTTFSSPHARAGFSSPPLLSPSLPPVPVAIHPSSIHWSQALARASRGSCSHPTPPRVPRPPSLAKPYEIPSTNCRPFALASPLICRAAHIALLRPYASTRRVRPAACLPSPPMHTSENSSWFGTVRACSSKPVL